MSKDYQLEFVGANTKNPNKSMKMKTVENDYLDAYGGSKSWLIPVTSRLRAVACTSHEQEGDVWYDVFLVTPTGKEVALSSAKAADIKPFTHDIPKSLGSLLPDSQLKVYVRGKATGSVVRLQLENIDKEL